MSIFVRIFQSLAPAYLLIAGCRIGTSAESMPPAYPLGVGDTLLVNALHAEEVSGKLFPIGEDGSIVLPVFGAVRVSGLSVREAESAIAEKLRPYVRQPQVSLSIAEYRSQPVSVLGAVNKAGVYQLRGDLQLVQLISLAGGLRADAGHRITITRKLEQGPIPLNGARRVENSYVADISVASMVTAQNPAENISLRPHDLVSVGTARMIYVIGDVRKAGGFVLGEQESLSVLQALSLAEGLLPTAATSNSKIVRQSSSGRTEIAVDLKGILGGKRPDQLLQPDDILFVPGSWGKKAAVRVFDSALQIGTGIAIWRR